MLSGCIKVLQTSCITVALFIPVSFISLWFPNYIMATKIKKQLISLDSVEAIIQLHPLNTDKQSDNL